MSAKGSPGRLADILAADLRILLVAINPAPLSLGKGLHFATPTNAFWKLLHASGLTRRLLRPEDAADLIPEGIGLTSPRPRADLGERTGAKGDARRLHA